MVESPDTCRVSRHGFSCLGLGGLVSTLVCLVLAHVLSFCVSSCLILPDCILTMSLSGINKCLFCVETLAFLSESRPLDPFTVCLLAVKRLFLQLLLFYGYNVC